MAHKKDSFWITYADLMTVLMIIFLFISLSYMGLMEYQRKNQTEIVTQYQQTRVHLYNDLQKAFVNDFASWNIELNKDLSIKFSNPEVLFLPGQSTVSETFKGILSKFFPKYLDIISKPEYRDKITEIRIEGHTDETPLNLSNDPYIDNIKLSQDRSRQVLSYLRSLPCYSSLSSIKKKELQYLLTANGFSFGRTVDSTGRLTIQSNSPVDNRRSRRVEFKIVTSSEKLVEEIITNM